MSAVCQALGASPGFGRSISHSHVRTGRRFDPGIHHERYWVPSPGRRARLRASAQGIRTIDRRGIDAVVARNIARGEKV